MLRVLKFLQSAILIAQSNKSTKYSYMFHHYSLVIFNCLLNYFIYKNVTTTTGQQQRKKNIRAKGAKGQSLHARTDLVTAFCLFVSWQLFW